MISPSGIFFVLPFIFFLAEFFFFRARLLIKQCFVLSSASVLSSCSVLELWVCALCDVTMRGNLPVSTEEFRMGIAAWRTCLAVLALWDQQSWAQGQDCLNFVPASSVSCSVCLQY